MLECKKRCEFVCQLDSYLRDAGDSRDGCFVFRCRACRHRLAGPRKAGHRETNSKVKCSLSVLLYAHTTTVSRPHHVQSSSYPVLTASYPVF